jgi:peptidoglycan hydrolase-like protein with peptidoglycan-binding domain
MRALLVAVTAFALLADAAASTPIDMQAVNDAQWPQEEPAKANTARVAIDPVLIKAQLLLARARFSPGEIDGKPGDNFKKALATFATAQGLQAPNGLTEKIWRALAATSQELVLKEYTVSHHDLRGPFAKKIPAKMEQMRRLPALAYTNAREKLAEKFHMSEALLVALNPARKFDKSGEEIVVASAPADELSAKVGRIEVDKSAQVVKAYVRDHNLLAFYPATAGSAEKPAPIGRLKVTSVTRNPTYRYNPNYVSLSQIKSAYIDDAILRELALSEWFQSIARRVISACPCATRGAFERHCSSRGKKAGCGVDGARQRSRRDQGTRVGSSRSSVRSVHSAKASVGRLACRECPSRADAVERRRHRRHPGRG